MFGGRLAPTIADIEQSMPLPMIEVSGGVTYYGYCKRLGVGFDKPEWQIIRVTVSAGVTTPEYANGDTKFNKKWSDRTSLSYSR